MGGLLLADTFCPTVTTHAYCLPSLADLMPNVRPQRARPQPGLCRFSSIRNRAAVGLEAMVSWKTQ